MIANACVAGCTPFARSVPEAKLMQGGGYAMIPGIGVPKVDGVEGCGAQALATVIAHLDRARDAAALAAELPWHDVGATPIDLLLRARKEGFTATIARGTIDELAGAVQAGTPPLVMVDSGIEVRTLFTRYPLPTVMHWAVVSGVAHDRSSVLVAAKGARHHVIKRGDFERRWSESDCCMIMLRPAQDSVKATADERR